MSKVSRRSLVTGLAASASATAVVAAVPKNFDPAKAWQQDVADAPTRIQGEDYRFFTNDKAALMAGLLNRIIPADELGPGAHDAGVTLFLDRQLAGKFGQAQSLYTQGPWAQGTDSQGYQARQTPAQLYRQALAGIERHSKSTYQKSYAELAPAQQDDVLHALENKAVDLGPVPRDQFFTLLLQNASEGYFSDPLYGGN